MGENFIPLFCNAKIAAWVEVKFLSSENFLLYSIQLLYYMVLGKVNLPRVQLVLAGEELNT